MFIMKFHKDFYPGKSFIKIKNDLKQSRRFFILLDSITF
jgi:hypothetical protein